MRKIFCEYAQGSTCYLWEEVLGQCDNKDTKKQDPFLRRRNRVGLGNIETFHSMSWQTSLMKTLALCIHGVCAEMGTI